MKNKALKIITYFTVFAFMLASTGCSSIKDLRNIRISSTKVESFGISGLKTANAVISVTIFNPAKDIGISDIEGIVERYGETIGKFYAEPLIIEGRCESTVTVKGKMELAPGISPLAVMSFLHNSGPEAFTVTASFKAKLGKGIAKGVTLKRIPVADLIRNIKK